ALPPGRGPRLPARPGRTRRRQQEGDAGGVAVDRGVPQESSGLGSGRRVRIEFPGLFSQRGERMKRMVLAGILAGVVVFVWSAVDHMVLAIGHWGVKTLPREGAGPAGVAGG